MKLSDKNILITGASSGIGYALVKKLAAEKCNLALIARRKEILDELAGQLKNTGSKIITFPCDVTVKEEVKRTIDEIVNQFGGIDLAILNSGVSGRSPVKYYSSDEAKKIFDVNVIGMINCMEILLPHYIKNKKGIIAGVSSLADGRGFPKSGFYCASKAAATLILESARIELMKYNVKVITIKPGFVKTPMTDKNDFKMPFLMDVDKAAGIILNGIKKEKRIIQFPLPTVLGAKILKLLPDKIFDFIARRT